MEFMIAIYILLTAHLGETTQEQLQYRDTYVQTEVLPPSPSDRVEANVQRSVKRQYNLKP